LALGAWALAEPLAGAFAPRALALAVLIAGGLVVFAAAALLTGATGLGDVKRYLRRDPA
jgi:hypothetical protein